MMILKKKGNRYYREDRFGMRSFPISKVEAERLLKNGEAELVEKFIFDFSDVKEMQVQEEQTNIISITERIEKKKEEQKTQELIERFIQEYLPKLTQQDLQKMLTSDKEEMGAELVKACMRIDLEKGLK